MKEKLAVTAGRFAARLKELREAAALTQQQLADQVGLSLGGLRHLEQGDNEPTWTTILALAKVLGVSCEDFDKEPAERPPQGRGRPAKPKPETATLKRPRGRPRKKR